MIKGMMNDGSVFVMNSISKFGNEPVLGKIKNCFEVVYSIKVENDLNEIYFLTPIQLLKKENAT